MNSSPEKSSPENIARFLVSKVGPATGVKIERHPEKLSEKIARFSTQKIDPVTCRCPPKDAIIALLSATNGSIPNF